MSAFAAQDREMVDFMVVLKIYRYFTSRNAIFSRKNGHSSSGGRISTRRSVRSTPGVSHKLFYLKESCFSLKETCEELLFFDAARAAAFKFLGKNGVFLLFCTALEGEAGGVVVETW